jgi:hypothetical protein
MRFLTPLSGNPRTNSDRRRQNLAETVQKLSRWPNQVQCILIVKKHMQLSQVMPLRLISQFRHGIRKETPSPDLVRKPLPGRFTHPREARLQRPYPSFYRTEPFVKVDSVL